MSPLHHGQQAVHPDYPYHQGTAHHQLTTDHTASSTTTERLRPPASWWLADPLDAVHAHTPSPCARRCLPHDPTAPWTPSRTSKLRVPGGDSPPPARHGPHHALHRTRVAAASRRLYAPCMSTVSVHGGACPMTPPRHGQQAVHAGYRGHQGTVHQQPTTGRTTLSTITHI
jgi:hypothetical protein